MGKILPILLLLLGTGAGLASGYFMRPQIADGASLGAASANEENSASGATEFVKLSNQFVIPLVENGAVNSVAVMALSLEVESGYRDLVFEREPRLRDSFLQAMFDHANIGGFRGDFTEAHNLNMLRASLRQAAIADLGDIASDVLILEIARQDY